MRYSCNRRSREEASASIWCQDGFAAETSTRCQLGKTCVCGSWVGPKRNRHILACSGLVQLKWPVAGILARLLPPACTFRTITKHREYFQKFVFCPRRSITLVFPGFFAYLANCFGFPAYPCMSMPAGTAPVKNFVLCAALDPKNISGSRPVSR
jgi:hypothetical protein